MKLRALPLLGLSALLLATACDKDTPTDTNPTTDDTGDSTPTVTDADNDGFNSEEDCDDLDAFVYPGAEETIGDGVDSDCDGYELCYVDGDGDGYGGETTGTTDSMDCSAAGFAATADDCDDSDTAYNPAATEDDCADPNDYNCDGSVGYADADGDGYAACEECDDTNAAINPAATELVADGIDQDCDGGDVCYVDGDSDGYRNMDTSLTVASADMDCADDGEGAASETADDCDDADAAINPGASETWYDGVDSDCDGGDDYDADGDGYTSDAYSGDDCDDSDSGVNPGATDTPQNGSDEDCDGSDAPYSVADLSAGDLVITEVMRDSYAVNDSNGEWFEILNSSGGTVDLDGLYVYDDGSDAFTVSGTYLVEDGEYFVFGVDSSTSTNGGAAVDYDWGSASTFALGNSADEVYIADSSAKATVFDEVVFDNGGQGGGGYFPDNAGYAMSLDPSYADDDSNDFGGHWCDPSSSMTAGDYGTPGSANDSCGFTYTFSADVSSIFTSKCATCHTSSASGGLTAIGTWSSTVQATSSQASSYYLVDPFDADSSYLWAKIEGTHSSLGGSGASMPKGTSLTSAQETTIETWIEEGAPE